MKRIALIALFVLSVVLASRLPQIRAAATGGYIEDHCVTGLHQTFESGAISSAVNTPLVAPVTGLNIYVCSYTVNQAGGTGSVQFSYGTGATCGTGNQTLGTLYTANSSAGTATNVVVGSGSTTVLDTNAGAGAMVPSQRLCVTSVGTIVQSVGGTFVQE